MCGIAGILRLGAGQVTPEDVGLVGRMTDAIAHRGPDDHGIWNDARVALGFRRLSIIDLSSAGHQPMGNEDGSVQIIYNGETYNFRELLQRFQLKEKGHAFRSRTDTEVLIHLYEELGPAMGQHLNGMFAFALWDQKQQLLHLVRDPYGVKPLFYQQDADYFRFGSEIKVILADARFQRRVNLQAINDFLTFDYIPGTQTAFAGVHEVPPGHWMTIDSTGKTTLTRYWEASWAVDESITAETSVARARELMEQAVQRQLVADVPVGVMLSGGLDSSALVAYMSRHHPDPIHTYSVGFEDASFNELPWARIVAQQFKTIQREVVVTADRARALLLDYLRFIDEPYADGSAIPTYYVCQMAREDVTVVLSGEGGDEAFAGYETYAAYKASKYFRHLPAALRNGVIRPLVNQLPVSHKKLSLEFKLKRFLGGQDLSPAEAHLWWRVVLTEAQKSALWRPEVRERFAAEPSLRHFSANFDRPGPSDTLARLMRLDCAVFLPDDLMIKNDRMSMAHSLEARVPFTDPDLTEFMSRVPERIKLPGLKKKRVMREALTGVLPESILNKKKVGLEMPYARWLRQEMRDLTDKYLGPANIQATGLFRPEAVGQLVQEHLDGRRDHGRALWGLLNIMLWLEIYQPSVS